MSRLLPLLILSVMGLSSPSALGQGPAKDKAVAQPAVVRTWGDILDQPAITLGDGKKVRLGVEATTVPQKSGFLAYVLLEDTKWTSRVQSVGPVDVELRRPKDEKGLEPLARLRLEPEARKGKRLLFAGTQVVDQPGEYVLVFRDDGKEIGRTPITVTKKESQPWFPFALPERLSRASRLGEDMVLALDFQNRERAVPVCDGSLPLLTDAPEIPRKQPLPRWVFEEPDASLKLEANAHNLRLESKTDLIFGETNVLVRLWVNDVPYHGTPKKKLDVLPELLKLKSGVGKQFRIDWKFDPDMVQARKGDRIGVQLLYCPEGWQNFDPRVPFNALARAKSKDDVLARLPLLSNKAEFVVGSEPAVVRTWDELLEQKPILLANGKNVRIGLETKKIPSRSAFLVYALVEDKRAGRNGDDFLGPLKVEISRIRRPGELDEARAKPGEALAKSEAYLEQGKHLLFAKSLVVDRPGDYVVTFRNERDFVVASAAITAAEEQAHPWLPFGGPAREDKVTKEGLRVHWMLQNHLAAVPLCDGNRPLLSDRRAIPTKQPLPRWVFEKPDAGLQLTADHRSLRLESKNELSLAAEQFLFRLWVNDKPYALPKQKPQEPQPRAGQPLDVESGKKLVIDWAFNAKILQAKKGDRIAVQLLYCPDDWKEFQPEGNAMRGRLQRVQQKKVEQPERILAKGEFIVIPDMPLLSNKVEFVVP